MKSPRWELFVDGTSSSVGWKDHQPNKRFAVYRAGTKEVEDNLILDRETGLIWPRNANIPVQPAVWSKANVDCRSLKIAHRLGWRLPSVEELSSLIDTRHHNPALPNGHPFVNVQFGPRQWAYWTCTRGELLLPNHVWFVNVGDGDAGLATTDAPDILGFIWPVRGGFAGVNWN